MLKDKYELLVEAQQTDMNIKRNKDQETINEMKIKKLTSKIRMKEKENKELEQKL